MDAKYKTGMAALEEWLQEQYVEYFEDADDYKNKPELLAGKIEDLLLKDGTRNYIIYEDKMYYLINKSVLPKEIQDGLIGGDTTDYALYTRLIDVYGVTDDLKVYYCNTDTGAVYGNVDVNDVNLNEPVDAANNDPNIKSMLEDVLTDLGVEINEELGITTGNLASISDLEIDGNKYEISDLKILSEMKNLNTIIIQNFNDARKLESLNGVEGCPKLYYIYLKNCDIDDYSNLSKVLNLRYLYMYLPPSTMDTNKANKQVTNLGNGLENADKLEKLDYLGISGVVDFFEKVDGNNNYDWKYQENYDKHVYSSNTRSNLADISGLSKFNSTIKDNLSYIFLHCNNISSVECLENYTAIIDLELNCNSNLKSLSGLKNHDTIEKILAHNCSLMTIEDLDGDTALQILTIQGNGSLTSLTGIENDTSMIRLLANSCNIQDITALSLHKTNLINLNLENNANLVNVSTLGNCVKINKLYLNGCNNMNAEQLKNALANATTHILKNCGLYYSLPSKYTILFVATSTSIDYSYSKLGKYLEDTSEEVVAINGGVEQITRLSLNGQKNLSNTKINEILSKLPNLEYVSLLNCTKLNSLDFVKGTLNTDGTYKNPLTKIIELDLRKTAINGEELKKLNDYSSNMATIIISFSDFKAKDIQKLINNVSDSKEIADGSWVDSQEWALYGFCVEAGTPEQYATIDFEGCDRNILKQFRSNFYSGNGYIIYDFSKLEYIDYVRVEYQNFDVRVPKQMGELFFCSKNSIDIVDFSKAVQLETMVGYMNTSVDVRPPSNPVKVSKGIELNRNVDLATWDVDKLFDIDEGAYMIVRGQYPNWNPSNIEKLKDFSGKKCRKFNYRKG